jgi:hypothetical protein
LSPGTDLWIRWITIGCVTLLALIAGTVSYLYMQMLVARHGQRGWVSALVSLSVDGMGPRRVHDVAGGLAVWC